MCSVLSVFAAVEGDEMTGTGTKRMISDMSVEMVQGEAISRYEHFIIEWRLQYFKEFPYLYNGTLVQEKEFSAQYIKEPSARVIVAKNEGDFCGYCEEDYFLGFATGISVSESTLAEVLEPVLDQPRETYYIGEVIFSKAARGKGLLDACLSYLDEIRKMGYTKVCFITVQRDENHPMRPAHYRDGEAAWLHFGFEKSEQTITVPWDTIQPNGSTVLTDNVLNVWVKNL